MGMQKCKQNMRTSKCKFIIDYGIIRRDSLKYFYNEDVPRHPTIQAQL